MTAKTRIYIVRTNGGEDEALIRAKTRGQALAHFARRSFVAELPSQDDLLLAAGSGLKVEEAVDLDDAA